MAMPKKGSRSIVVDEMRYRWRLHADNDWCKSMVVAVEPVTDGEFSMLTIDTSTRPPDNHPDFEYVSVTPAVVEVYIRQALAKGWKPTEKGKPFALVADAAMVAE